MSERPIALITGVSRSIGIGASIAKRLAETGWNVAMTFWQPYDATMPWGTTDIEHIRSAVHDQGALSVAIEADLSETTSPSMIFEVVEKQLGSDVKKMTLLNRTGTPKDCSNLVSFICSKEGGWINAQILYSNGGLK